MTAEKLAAGSGPVGLEEEQTLPPLTATRALKEKRHTLAASGFPDRKTVFFRLAWSSEINSELVPISFSALLADAAVANVEGDGL
jgi:hypothetical protein